MSEADVRAVYEFCRQLAPLMRKGMDILAGEILSYSKTRDAKSLKTTLFNFYDDLGMHVPRYQQIDADTDWAIVESCADKSETRFPRSVARHVLQLPTIVRDGIRLTAEKISEPEFDSLVDWLYGLAVQGRFTDIVRDDLFAEEGRVLLAMKAMGTAPKGKPGRKPDISKRGHAERANALRSEVPQPEWKDCAKIVNSEFKLIGADQYDGESLRLFCKDKNRKRG